MRQVAIRTSKKPQNHNMKGQHERGGVVVDQKLPIDLVWPGIIPGITSEGGIMQQDQINCGKPQLRKFTKLDLVTADCSNLAQKK